MPKDPAFLFYDGDAARDVSHMNRLERGAYFDLVQAQRKFGGYTTEQVRKILGKDFDEVWPAIELILTKDEEGKYFIEWVKNSIENRKEHAEKQRKRIQDYWDKKKLEGKDSDIPRNNDGITTDIPLENENENENIILNKRENHLFKDDEFSDFEKFKDQFKDTEFADADLKYYFDSFMDWSLSGGNKKKDWIATVRNGMRKDKTLNKYRKSTPTETKPPLNYDPTKGRLLPNGFVERLDWKVS